ncbi:MFS transporter [Amycolatopsis sp. NPDC004169]|uniref:MDR family MFS transporter n=1 Tax=Amycolatopsis sp. NPDC004169 TaxID=3154453 RepID=UPI0033BC8164
MRRALAQTVGGLPSAFWWLWTTTLVNRLGGFVATFLALYLTVGRGYSAAYAGLVVTLYAVGGTAANVVGGLLADRIGRRPVLMAAQLATAVSTLLLGLTDGRAAIAVVAVLVGFTSNASRPAVMAIMADVVPERDRTRAFSLNFWAVNIGFGAAAAVAGLVAEEGFLPLFIGEAAATLVCAFVVYLRIPETRPAADAQQETAGQSPRGNVVWLDRPFLALTGLTALVCLTYQQASTTLPVSMAREGLSPAAFGLVIGVNGLLIVVLQIPVTRMVGIHRRGPLLVVAALLSGWGFGLLVFASTIWFYAFTVAVWTVGESILAPAAMDVATTLAPVGARGRYLGVYSLSSSVPALLGPATGGWLFDHVGADAIWLGCGGLGTVAAIGYAVLVRTRRLRRTVNSVITTIPAHSPEQASEP